MGSELKADNAAPDQCVCLILSVWHLSIETEAFLKNNWNPLISKGVGGSFYLKLPDDITKDLFSNFPDELLLIVKWAHENGFRLIDFNRQARMFDKFPVFNVNPKITHFAKEIPCAITTEAILLLLQNIVDDLILPKEISQMPLDKAPQSIMSMMVKTKDAQTVRELTQIHTLMMGVLKQWTEVTGEE